MAPKLSETKLINQRNRDTVFGYIRKCELLFIKQSSTVYTIPPIISHICLLYYYQKEYFIPFNELYINIKNNNKTIIESQSTMFGMSIQEHMAYGAMYIYPQDYLNSIFHWKIQLLSSNNLLQFGVYKIWSLCGYTFQNSGKIYLKGDIEGDCVGKFGKYYSPKLKTNDIIDIMFNIKHRYISLYVNNINIGIAFKNIDIKYDYQFGVLLRKNDSIKLLHFQQMIANDNKTDENINFNYDKVLSLFRFNLNIKELVIHVLNVHTNAECNTIMIEKINKLLQNHTIDAKEILKLGKKAFVTLLKSDCSVKLGHGCRAFKYIEKWIQNPSVDIPQL